MRLACAALLLAAGVGLNAATPKAETSKTEAPPVLRKSPEFVIKFVDGHEMLLSSLKGKVVALLMVHTTCPHCQHTSQVFTQLTTSTGRAASSRWMPRSIRWPISTWPTS